MPETPAGPHPDTARLHAAGYQHTALLRTTLKTIARYTKQMQDDLDVGELNIAHADQLGRSVLTALREAASISVREEIEGRPVMRTA
jgi:hypothetical protein